MRAAFLLVLCTALAGCASSTPPPSESRPDPALVERGERWTARLHERLATCDRVVLRDNGVDALGTPPIKILAELRGPQSRTFVESFRVQGIPDEEFGACGCPGPEVIEFYCGDVLLTSVSLHDGFARWEEWPSDLPYTTSTLPRRPSAGDR